MRRVNRTSSTLRALVATLTAFCLVMALVPTSAIASVALSGGQTLETAADDDSDVVDATNLDDPDTVTMVEAPELTATEYDDVVAEAYEAIELADASETATDDDVTDDDADDDDADDDGDADDGDTTDDDADDDDEPSVAITSATVSWTTEDDVDDDDESRLTLAKSGTSTFSVSMRLNVMIDADEAHAIGSIQITIPKTIFTYRTGSAAGTMSLSVPAAPDSNATFSYTETEEGYVLTNTKKLSAQCSLMFEFSITNLNPYYLIGNGEFDDGTVTSTGVEKYVSDPFYALIEVLTSSGETVSATSNSIDASIDTNVTLSSVNVSISSSTSSCPSALVPDTTETSYRYVCIAVSPKTSGNQPYTTAATVDVSTLLSTYDGALLLGAVGASTIVNEDESATSITCEGNSSGYVYVYVAIPTDNFENGYTYYFYASASMTLTETDDGESYTKSASKNAMLQLYDSVQSDKVTSASASNAFSKANGSEQTYGLNNLLNGTDVTTSYKLTTTIATDATAYNTTYDAVTTTTEDSTVTLDGTTLVEGDYEFTSVSIGTPEVKVWSAQTMQESTSTTQTGVYGNIVTSYTKYQLVTDSTMTLKPDIDVWGRSGSGEWVQYANVSWQSGSRVVTVYNGASASGSVVSFPEGVTAYYYTSTTTAAYVNYSVTATVTLKADSENVQSIVSSLFDDSDEPTTKLVNSATTSFDDEDGETFKTTTDSGSTQLDYFVVKTGSTMKHSLTSYANDVSDQVVDLTYSATVYECTNISDKSKYDDAIDEGIVEEETSCTFYVLLPTGVLPRTSTVAASGSRDSVTDVQLVKNYQKSGRALMIVDVSVGSSAATISSSTSKFSYSGYGQTIKITYDAVYAWESILDFGKSVSSVAAFESSRSSLGSVTGYLGEPDDPTYGNNKYTDAGGAEDIMTDLDPDSDAYAFLYASDSTTLEVNIAATTSLSKAVMANDSGIYNTGLTESSPVNVYDGGTYMYRIQLYDDSSNMTAHIVIYDALESYVPDETDDDYGDTTWQGTLLSVDTSVLENLGCAPVVYYSTLEGIDLSDGSNTSQTDLTDTSVWSSEAPDDLSSVTAIAVDCTTNTDGEDFVLEGGESLSVSITMQAPTALELATAAGDASLASSYYDVELEAEGGEAGLSGGAHAYNATSLLSTVSENGDDWGVETLKTFEYAKVGLSPVTATVTKTFDDADDQDGLRPDSVTVELLADGEVVRTTELSDDNGWTYTFENLSATKDGVALTYTLAEVGVTGYESSVTGSVDENGCYSFAVVNTHEPETIDISGTKSWVDDTDDVRPDSVTVSLYADGTLVGVEDGDRRRRLGVQLHRRREISRPWHGSRLHGAGGLRRRRLHRERRRLRHHEHVLPVRQHLRNEERPRHDAG